MFWALTAAVALVATAVALWPGDSTHEATATVSVGIPQPGQTAKSFTFDAAPEARAGAVGSLIALVRDNPAVEVHVVATARTQHGAIRAVRQTVALAQSTATAVIAGRTEAGANRQANLFSKLGDAEMAAAKFQATQRRIDEWHRTHGNADPAQQLAVVDAALAGAQGSTPRDESLIARLQAQKVELTSAETEFNRLLEQHEAADRAAKRTKEQFERASSLTNDTNAQAEAGVVSSDIRVALVEKQRPQGRLAISAILFIIAIAVADVLFLTRKRFAVPHAEETSRARRARRRRQRQQRHAHKPRTHRPSTAHRWHAWRADIDLTAEELPAQRPRDERQGSQPGGTSR